MSERSKSENVEKDPEEVVGDAILSTENKDAVDPIMGSKWAQGGKSFLKNEMQGVGRTVRRGGNVGSLGSALAFRTCRSVIEFAVKAVKKRGKLSFNEGYEIGKDIFDFDNLQDKK